MDTIIGEGVSPEAAKVAEIVFNTWRSFKDLEIGDHRAAPISTHEGQTDQGLILMFLGMYPTGMITESGTWFFVGSSDDNGFPDQAEKAYDTIYEELGLKPITIPHLNNLMVVTKINNLEIPIATKIKRPD